MVAFVDLCLQTAQNISYRNRHPRLPLSAKTPVLYHNFFHLQMDYFCPQQISPRYSQLLKIMQTIVPKINQRLASRYAIDREIKESNDQ
jgi:hypothetical protein